MSALRGVALRRGAPLARHEAAQETSGDRLGRAAEEPGSESGPARRDGDGERGGGQGAGRAERETSAAPGPIVREAEEDRRCQPWRYSYVGEFLFYLFYIEH